MGHECYCYGKISHLHQGGDDKFVELVSVKKPDLVIMWDHNQHPEHLEKLSKMTKLYMFNWDDPHSVLPECKGMELKKEGVKFYTRIYSCCKDTENFYLSNGAKEWYYLSPCAGAYHFPEYSLEYECDVALITTNLYSKNIFPTQLIERSELFDTICKATDINVKLYGPENFKNLYPERYQGYAKYYESGKVYSNSKITISTHVSYGDSYLNERDVQTLTCGGLLLTDPMPNIEQITEGGCVVMRSLDSNDIVQQIREILKNYSDYLPIREKALKVSDKFSPRKWCDAILN